MTGRPWASRVLAAPRHEVALAAEAFLWLMVARIDTLRPASHYTALLGDRDKAAARANPDHTAKAAIIGRAVARAARRAPFRALCLQQALATRRMLKRRNLPATIKLGVHPDLSRWQVSDHAGRDTSAAHAWVVCGHTVILGRIPELDQMVVVGTFA